MPFICFPAYFVIIIDSKGREHAPDVHMWFDSVPNVHLMYVRCTRGITIYQSYYMRLVSNNMNLIDYHGDGSRQATPRERQRAPWSEATRTSFRCCLVNPQLYYMKLVSDNKDNRIKSIPRLCPLHIAYRGSLSLSILDSSGIF